MTISGIWQYGQPLRVQQAFLDPVALPQEAGRHRRNGPSIAFQEPDTSPSRTGTLAATLARMHRELSGGTCDALGLSLARPRLQATALCSEDLCRHDLANPGRVPTLPIARGRGALLPALA